MNEVKNVPTVFCDNVNTEVLNEDITEEEIMKAIQNLKNGKSSGIDEIMNEHIKNSTGTLMPLYIKLFNKILNEGNLPDEWGIGLVIPLYKKKGDVKDPNNYRGITLLSCLGKLFTAILNNRLMDFMEDNKILRESQAGFRKSYSTIDHIFH